MAAFAKPEAKEMMRDGKQVWRQSHYFVSVFSTRMKKTRDQQDKYERVSGNMKKQN